MTAAEVSPASASRPKSFEGVFLNTLTKELFSSIKTDESVFGGGFGEETWRSMQSEQMAASMAQNGGLGHCRPAACPISWLMQEISQ